MNYNIVPKFELGVRAYIAILTICFTIIIVTACSLAIYTIYQVSKSQTETEPAKLSIEIPKSEFDNIHNISALIAPEALKKRGVPDKVIEMKKKHCYNYIKRYKPIAETEMKKYGIPVYITLAQGLLESDAGQSRLARENNNHFGIKCFKRNCKKDHCSNHTDDSHKDFFRKYNTAWDSYRDHSFFLLKDRYKHLLQLPKDDFEGWAYGLQKAGYATDKNYGDKLIKIYNSIKFLTS